MPGTTVPPAAAGPVTASPAGVSARTPASDYAELRRLIRQEGLLRRRPGYYAVKIGVMLALMAAGWTVFALIGNSWWQMAVAVFLAGMFGQAGFLGHEAGHRQIFRSRRANNAVGLLCGNLLIGMSFGWWVTKHNRHHAFPNHETKDPDIAIAAIAFTRDQARRRSGLARVVARYQAWLFFPLLTFEALSLHVTSIRAVLRGGRHRWLECGLLVAHCAGFTAAAFLVMSPLRAVAFIAIQQGLLGLYLGCAFAPNHKGMPVLSDAEAADFLRRQVLTSRNVTGGRVTETLLGGLNYQIEHHLFPGMPRPSLRRCRILVRAFCAQIGVGYCEKSFLRSYGDVLRHLHAAGQATTP
jgi:fatty acid desaturase